MKQLVSLIVLMCLTIDDKVFAIPKVKRFPGERCNENLTNFKTTLENVLHVGVTKVWRKTPGGFTNRIFIFKTDEKKLIFVKKNSHVVSPAMFDGEIEGLKTIRDTKTILVPQIIATGYTNCGQHFLVEEFLKMKELKCWTYAELGRKLADMHMCNLNSTCGKKPAVKKFGFHVSTSVGVIPQNNSWTDDWITFFIENRIDHQLKMLNIDVEFTLQKKLVIENYWPKIKKDIRSYFSGINVKPSLLHGDLWSGNVARLNRDPVIFDPAVFYGHHEYDIASTIYSKNYPNSFYNAYFKKIPKAKGFEKRMKLYSLFYKLNNWNEFKSGYETIEHFKKLLKLE